MHIKAENWTIASSSCHLKTHLKVLLTFNSFEFLHIYSATSSKLDSGIDDVKQIPFLYKSIFNPDFLHLLICKHAKGDTTF